MRPEDAERLVQIRWKAEGECATCGLRSELYEYGDLRAAVQIDERASIIRLRCLSPTGGEHLGVRFRYASEVARS